MPQYLSPGADKVLAMLQAGNRPEGEAYVPGGIHAKLDMRVPKSANTSEPVFKWFRELIDELGDLDLCLLEDHIALLGSVHWQDGELFAAGLQALVTIRGRIEDLYWGNREVAWQYLRVDLDLQALGPLLSEPKPHLHTVPHGPPRVAFSLSSERTLVADFLEFLYLNYQYRTWIEWARSAWLARRANPAAADHFDEMRVAFDTGHKSPGLVTHIEDLKSILSDAKADLSIAHVPISRDAIRLTY